LLTSALCKRHWRQECSRSASTTKWGLVALRALLILLALGVPARAQDSIAEWLKQDEVDSQIDEVRPDLNALTDQQLQDIFKIGREQVDNHQLIERGGENHKPVLYIWVIAIAVGIAAMRDGPGCLNRVSASISGASAGVKLPSGGAAA
jgi:hypothetical protein